MTARAILTDVTKCIGCEDCIAACKKIHELPADRPRRWQTNLRALSETRWTTITEVPGRRFVREHCRHCIDPGCAAACPVGALKRTEDGPVVYDATICMGCRYCMMACPFGMTRYEWSSAAPRIRKCILCQDKLAAGELDQPGCTAACPTGATIYGEREELLAEARRRIAEKPELYIDRIWGETEVGGTSVLYISDVPLEHAGWPERLDDTRRPEAARKVLHTVPWTFAGVAAAATGLFWITDRRKAVAAAEGESDAAEAASPSDDGAKEKQ